jgi:5-methylcytosine-specific restriction enzyme subunit McrC
MRLYQHSLDLSREPAQILSVLRDIAGELAGATPHP